MTFVTNRIWEVTKKKYKQLNKKNKHFSRHKDFSSYIKRIIFGAKTIEDNPVFTNSAPAQPCLSEYRINFGKNKNFMITAPFKVMTSHMHSNDRRITMVYQGLGSYTFELREATPLTKYTLWSGSYRGCHFTCKMRINEQTMQITGKGKDDNGNEIRVKQCQLAPIDCASWKGYLELANRIEPLEVPCLEFLADGTVNAARWKSEESGLFYEITGRVHKSSNPGSTESKIELTITDSNNEVYNFNGTIDILKTSIKGTCSP